MSRPDMEMYASPVIKAVKLLLPTKLNLVFAQWSSLFLNEFQDGLELLSITLDFFYKSSRRNSVGLVVNVS
jgi:hypothetical protein